MAAQRFAIIGTFFLVASFAEPVHSELAFYCDQLNEAFFVSIYPREKPRLTQHYTKSRVNWIGLLKLGPEKNFWGEKLRTGSRQATRKCGRLDVVFSSGFLNSNPQGELGALDFPVVEIKKGKKILLARTALEQCYIELSRYNYFGSCPDSWARSIEVLPTSSGHVVQVNRVFSDEAYEDGSKRDVYK